VARRAARVAQKSETVPSVGLVWRESLRVFADHSGAILMTAFVGFALPLLIGAVVSSAITYDYYANLRNTNSAFSIQYASYAQWITQGVIGLLTVGFARGVLTWVGLNAGGDTPVNLRGAFGASLRRWSGLLLNLLVAGIFAVVCALGVTMMLRDLRLDTTNVNGRFGADLFQMWRAFYIRVLNAVVPTPDSPFNELLQYARLLLRTQFQVQSGVPISARTVPQIAVTWAFGISGLVLMVLAETFLRFRNVCTMACPRTRNPLIGLTRSAKLGWRYFGRLTLHIALLRFVFFVVTAIFITFPLTLAQSALFPNLFRLLGGASWVYSISNVLLTAAAAPILMLFTAFALIYDARLYRHLTAAQP
jgi:hypothetical protein